MSHYTVLGASGFIGSALCGALQGQEIFTPPRADRAAYLAQLQGRDLGIVFYCVGMTADFRSQPFATIDANLLLLREVLERCHFERLVYLSSTRVYAGADHTDEDAALRVSPFNPDHSYNLSKITAENLCLSSGRDTKVARLSNVYGAGMRSPNFLASVLDDAVRDGKVCFRTAPDSNKDYIAIQDALRYLLDIARHGRHAVYNVASGHCTAHGEIADVLRSRGIAADFAPDAVSVKYPGISVERLVAEFGKVKRTLFDDLSGLLASWTID